MKLDSLGITARLDIQPADWATFRRVAREHTLAGSPVSVDNETWLMAVSETATVQVLNSGYMEVRLVEPFDSPSDKLARGMLFLSQLQDQFSQEGLPLKWTRVEFSLT
ncbi:MAG: hypothetical protein JW910_18570 [Anaerolineae bacterium]|nr:hypothetical protein [Anaerolineae bacterium]